MYKYTHEAAKVKNPFIAIERKGRHSCHNVKLSFKRKAGHKHRGNPFTMIDMIGTDKKKPTGVDARGSDGNRYSIMFEDWEIK